MSVEKANEVAAAGLRAQSTRIRVITENLANSASTAATPDGMPYRRKVVTFANVLDRETGTEVVKVVDIRPATGEFPRRFDPGHPSADAAGYVLLPNVNPLIEGADFQQAQRSYKALLTLMEASGAMEDRVGELLK